MQYSSEQIIKALKEMNQNLGVIGTISGDGKPESAVVYFSFDNHGDIYFATRSESRKYKNIANNPNVSFVVYTTNPPATIQIEGRAEAITDAGDQAALFSDLVSLINKNNPNPPIDQLGESEIKFIKIAVRWARTLNFEVTKNEGESSEK